MRLKFAPYALALFVAVSLTALAQTARPAGPPPGPAGPPPTKVGIINIELAIIGSNEGQRDFAALQKRFEPKQNELQAMNKEVDDLKKQLSTQGDKLNDDARANLVKNIEQKQKVLQRSLEDAQNDFQTQQKELANQIGRKILVVLDKYAKDNGFAVILDVSNPQSGVLWAGASVDVTKNIVDAYNVESKVPPPAPAPAAGTGAGTGTTGAAARKPATPPASTNPPK
ncbi:MAG: OmpH family outer membrane protein [Terriglobales bacterium]